MYGEVRLFFSAYSTAFSLSQSKTITPLIEPVTSAMLNMDTTLPLYNFDATYDCEEWHVYGFEWTAEKAVWTVDGEIKRELLKSNLTPNRANLWPNEDMYIVLNNEVQTNATDRTTQWPNYLKIDYVEIYEKDN